MNNENDFSFLHNPIDLRFKSVRGAVAAHTPFTLNIYAKKQSKLSMFFVVHQDGQQEQYFEMQCEKGSQEDVIVGYERYSLTLNLHEGLYWYRFEADNGQIRLPLGKSEQIHPFLRLNNATCYQLTVFNQQYHNPTWLGQGVMYHIFVDRFCRGNDTPLKQGQCHGIWNNTPKNKDADGVVRCNEIFGGNLDGIYQKLDYIASLGVRTLYLSPIFESSSNHKYNTADYEQIDSNFGNFDDFVRLCDKAHSLGMRVILDGVFNHCGEDSKYFDKYGNWGNGAYLCQHSPYRDWFHLKNDGGYDCWWGIKTMPSYNPDSCSFQHYFAGEQGIVAKYLQHADGWRLDVVDELRDDFLDNIVYRAKSAKADCAIIGEVWEDATNKISNGGRRRYFLGRQLDGVMNYCVKKAIIAFVREGNSQFLSSTMFDIVNNYPKHALNNLMNLLDSHDTSRILTALYDEQEEHISGESLAGRVISGQDYYNARELLKIAAVLQYTLVGFPSLFYGDEAGLSGYGDPYCRACYPWGNVDNELIEFYRTLGKIRGEKPLSENGDFYEKICDEGVYAFVRKLDNEQLFIGATKRKYDFSLDGDYIDLMDGKVYYGERSCTYPTAFIMKKLV